MARRSKDHYDALGVSRKASSEEIRKAYRKKAKRHHPDASGGGDSQAFREAQEAYEALADPGRRAAYDADLSRRERGFGAGPGGSRQGDPGRPGGRAPGSDRRRGDPFSSPFGTDTGRRDWPGDGPTGGGRGTTDDIFGAEDELFDKILNELFGGGGRSGGNPGAARRGRSGFGGFGDLFSGGAEDPVYGDPRFEEPTHDGRGGTADPLNVVVHLAPDECYTGGTATVDIGGGRSLLADIPPGVHDGDVIRSQFVDRGGPRELRLRIRVD